MIQQNEENEKPKTDDTSQNEEAAGAKEKVTIEFPYSDILRAQAPKVFDVAE